MHQHNSTISQFQSIDLIQHCKLASRPSKTFYAMGAANNKQNVGTAWIAQFNRVRSQCLAGYTLAGKGVGGHY